jgi:hypothetical protein
VKRRQPNKWFKRGTLYGRAVDVLRTATGPMTAAEIGEAVLTNKPKRGTFSATFFLACLAVLELEGVVLE